MNRKVRNKISRIDRLRYAVKRYKGITIETDLEPYRGIVNTIHSFDFTQQSHDALIARSGILKKKILGGEPPDPLLPETFALVKESARRILNLIVFGVRFTAR